jgi:hypothetical protein
MDVDLPSLQLDTIYTPMAFVDWNIEHIVCFVNNKARGKSYSKCEACGLPGNSINQCHPFVNFYLVQALCSQQPDLVHTIKATYKQFPHCDHGRPSRLSTVKHLVAELAIAPQYPDALLTSDSLASDCITYLAPPDMLASDLYYGQTGTALVSFPDHTDVAGPAEPPVISFIPHPR